MNTVSLKIWILCILRIGSQVCLYIVRVLPPHNLCKYLADFIVYHQICPAVRACRTHVDQHQFLSVEVVDESRCRVHDERCASYY